MAFCLLKDSEEYLSEVVGGLPFNMSKGVVRGYWQKRKSSYYDANIYLTELRGVVESVKFALALDDTLLVRRASECAETCKRFILHDGALDDAFLFASDFAQNIMNVAVPSVEKFGLYGSYMRLSCSKWWRRALRKQHYRGLEKLEIDTGQVSFKRGIYSSDDTVARRREQKKRNADILRKVKMVNNEQQEYSLLELSALSTSNPKLRRMELMTRISGFEELAKEQGLVGEFYTVTAPSKYHSQKRYKKNGRYVVADNKKYQGYSPRETQEYLSGQWKKVRSAWQKVGIQPFGFRVVEPHHDGTPHWHLLLFMPKSQAFLARLILKKYALEFDGEELGAKKQRFKAVAIDPKKGSAVGYIAKYISKAVDGHVVDFDIYGNDAVEASERIEAWASTWGIRQFQQVGGASVTVWRELRRLEGEQDSLLLEKARLASQNGDWAEYCRLNSNKQIELMREVVEEYGAYGDERAEPVLGLFDSVASVGVVTRVYEWTLSGVGLPSEGVAVTPRSTINNCTGKKQKNEVYRQNEELAEKKRIQNDAYLEYLKQKRAGEIYEGGFDEFFYEYLQQRGYY